MKTQNYFSRKDIKINHIRRIELPVYSSDGKTLLSRPIICIFYPNGRLFSLMSLTLFRIRKKRGLPIIFSAEVNNFYCELRQML